MLVAALAICGTAAASMSTMRSSVVAACISEGCCLVVVFILLYVFEFYCLVRVGKSFLLVLQTADGYYKHSVWSPVCIRTDSCKHHQE